MKNLISISRKLRNQQGQALVIALVFLGIGALTLPPLMTLMGSALVQGTTFENRTAGLYAADAGIEQAIWYLDPENSPLIPGGLPVNTGESRTLPGISIDGRTVSVTLAYLMEDTYQIVSTSTSPTETISVTAVVSETFNNYTGIMNHVITSQGDYTIQGGQASVSPDTGDNAPISNYDGPWPGANELSSFYYVNTTPYASNTLNLANYPAGIPEILRLGTLDIVATANAVYTLEGDIYITGDTLIGMTGSNFTLDLNGHSIYVKSNTAGNQYALRIGGKCTLIGSGSIIAEGNIEFKPNMSTSLSDYIFVLSVNGKTYMQPNGNFYGTLAGSTEVYLQNGSVTYSSPFDEYGNYKIDFPGSGLSHFWGIISWSIS
ncbi:pilus assembly protein PilZ [Dehalococcoides mccartyi]|uniref:pilus assembly PilX family protein n=1 Tax=Dehalococcoides mccartyi TaxID=61435 RepID=UPI002FCB1E8B